MRKAYTPHATRNTHAHAARHTTEKHMYASHTVAIVHMVACTKQLDDARYNSATRTIPPTKTMNSSSQNTSRHLRFSKVTGCAFSFSNLTPIVDNTRLSRAYGKSGEVRIRVATSQLCLARVQQP